MPIRINRVSLVLALGVLSVPNVVMAQDKPELMLLVESPQRMSRTLAGSEPVCAEVDPNNLQAAPADPANMSSVRTRMAIIQQALAGKPLETNPLWCAQTAGNLGPINYTNIHSMCCANAACDQYQGCDSIGVPPGDPGEADTLAAISANGAIDVYRTDVRFGLMTSDPQPEAGGDAGGGFSIGSDVSPGVIAVQPVFDTGLIRLPVAGDFNLGVQNETAAFGPLIRGKKGRIAAGGTRGIVDAGSLNTNAVIGEADDIVGMHNDYVMHHVRGIHTVGAGVSTAGMLSDLLEYYEEEAQNDAAYECHDKYAVLITDGIEDHFTGGQSCNLGGGGCVEIDGGNCELRPNLTNGAIQACVPGGCPAAQVCEEGVCQTPVCVYPANWPYETAVSYTEQLLADHGVKVYVISFGDDAAMVDAITDASGTEPYLVDMGGDADAIDSIKDAINGIIIENRRGNLASKTRPLVMSPGAGDVLGGEDVRQWRFLSYTRNIGGDAYGRVEIAKLGCEPLDENDSGRPTALGYLQVADELAKPGSTRKVVMRDPVGDQPVGMVGSNPLIFTEATALLSGAFNESLIHNLTFTPEGVQDPIKRVGRQLQGYFGALGLPNGLNGAGGTGPRQLGAIMTGELVAIPPPRLGILSPAYTAFAQAYRDRPSMVAVGADDGQIHIFQVDDGHEVATVVPRAMLRKLKDGNPPAQGPLSVGEIAECRQLGNGGNEACPSDLTDVNFRTLLVGGVGTGGANIFGVDVTRIHEANNGGTLIVDSVFADGTARPYIWNVTNEHFAAVQGEDDAATVIVEQLGRSVSRPVLTHVLDEPGAVGSGQIKGAVVVGCGDGDAGATGRCVLVLDARTGAVIRKFDGADSPDLDAPMVGSPVVYPSGGVATAERAYLGDKNGRMWRVDMRARDPANWTIAVAWPPPPGNDDLGYTVGRRVVDRPTVSVLDNGRVAVAFGTGGDPADPGRAHMVSFTESVQFDAGGNQVFAVEGNYAFKLKASETLTGAPWTREDVMWFTTVERGVAGGCAPLQGRLYGIDSVKTGLNLNRDGDILNVVPRIPQYNEAGERDGYALSLLLPSGQVAYGLAIVSTPSCRDGEGSSSNLILNLTGSNAGGSAALRSERASGNQIIPSAFGLFTRRGGSNGENGGTSLSICLDCNTEGNPGFGAGIRQSPFPSIVTFWGGTFTN